jgi:hypothetical protein
MPLAGFEPAIPATKRPWPTPQNARPPEPAAILIIYRQSYGKIILCQNADILTAVSNYIIIIIMIINCFERNCWTAHSSGIFPVNAEQRK